MWGPAARAEIAAALADAFLAGEWERGSLRRRTAEALGVRRPRWVLRTVDAVLELYRERPADRPRELEQAVEHVLRELDEARVLRRPVPRVSARRPAAAEMGHRRWDVPEIATVAELGAFLDVHVGELLWLADARGLERRAPHERLRNYRYGWIARWNGALRVLEWPKPLLKELQRRVLHQILDAIPPDERAHGFRRGHSALTNARVHLGQEVVLGFDLEDFFASVGAGRAYGIFRAAGYPEAVAYTLAALCLNVVPAAEWARVPRPADADALAAHHRLGLRLAAPHLPQGAPTSPALANACALRLDRRLAGLAATFGATYSRYADDIVLSGGRALSGQAAVIRRTVAEIARDEGFRLNERKTWLTTQAGRQVVTGIVVNRRPNVPRREYDRLKAVLHDAVRHGPATANRAHVPDFRAHLLGRISWVASLNRTRGAKLRRLFDRIEWP